MSTAAVFLVIEKAFDTIWHPGLLYKLSEIQFPIRLFKLIVSFLTNRKFKTSLEGELSSPRKIAACVTHVSLFAPVSYSLYINDTLAAPGIHHRRMLNKLQLGSAAVGSWCQRWNVKNNEGKTLALSFSRRHRMRRDDLQMNARNISFVNSVKYLKDDIGTTRRENRSQGLGHVH
jgi:hypothetical protein